MEQESLASSQLYRRGSKAPSTRVDAVQWTLGVANRWYSINKLFIEILWYVITLNGVIALILLYFTEFSFACLLRHGGWIQTYIVCEISSSTFGQNWPTLQCGLSAIAELLVFFYFIHSIIIMCMWMSFMMNKCVHYAVWVKKCPPYDRLFSLVWWTCVGLIDKKLSYRRETALHGGLVIANSGRLELRDNIYGYYKSIFNHCDVFGQQSNRIRRKTQKGLLRCSMSFKVVNVGTNRKPVCNFLLGLVINSNWQLISHRCGVIAAYCSNFGHCVFEPPWGT